MSNKTYLVLVSVIFFIISVLHLCRLVNGWEVVFNCYTLPMWVSWAGVVLAGFLALRGYQASKKT